MSESNEIRLCIVGTGFSGTAALFHLVNRLVERRHDLPPVEIITIDERPINGPGYPYAPYELLPSHLCNNQARMMSLDGNDFYDWMVDNQQRLALEYPSLIQETHPSTSLEEWEPDPDGFYPRALFGVYLQERFEESRIKASRYGFQIKTLNKCRAVDGFREDDKINITVKNIDNGESKIIKEVDKLLLSTGHWNPVSDIGADSKEMFLDSPYPHSRLLSTVNKWSMLRSNGPLRILVTGMGPSAVDTIMSLTDSGSFEYSEVGRVVNYTVSNKKNPVEIISGSRSGFFPAVRGNPVDYEFRYLSEDTFEDLEVALGKKLKLNDILELIDSELREATFDRISWNDVAAPKFKNAYEKLRHDISCPEYNDLIHAILLKARRMKFYRHLGEQEKEIYDREFDTHFIRTAVPIPLQNAEKLIALFDAGVLDSVRMGYSKEPNPLYNGHTYEVRSAGRNTEDCRHADALIRAIGQDFSMSKHPSSLISSLLAQEELLANKEGQYYTGGVMLDSDESYGVIYRDPDTGVNSPSPNISSYGVLTRYWQNERNFSSAFIEAATWLAENWTDYCANQVPQKFENAVNS